MKTFIILVTIIVGMGILNHVAGENGAIWALTGFFYGVIAGAVLQSNIKKQ